MEPRTGLFVRIPSAQAHQLDVVAAQTRTAKQDIVTGLLERHLAGAPVDAAARRGDEPVLTADEAAALLRVDRHLIEARAAAGDLPGRTFDGAWRFSRRALLDWLAGSDGRRQAGFSA